MAEKTAFHAKVYGRVQGVGFRYSAYRVARSCNVTGWVRNDVDGSVEVFCEGDPGNVSKYRRWLQKGPPGSYVREVRVQETPAKGYTDFSITY